MSCYCADDACHVDGTSLKTTAGLNDAALHKPDRTILMACCAIERTKLTMDFRKVAWTTWLMPRERHRVSTAPRR